MAAAIVAPRRDPVGSRRLLVVLASTLAAMPTAACGTGSPSDPDNARCNDPRPTFGAPVVLPTHTQVAVYFTCEAAVQAGTGYVPNGPGLHAAAVWFLGDGAMQGIGYGDERVATWLVRVGVCIFVYDKRGLRECPG